MPKRTDIKTILIIGSGPIVIGQGCEFDYSGTQACKALREEGYQVVLVNSNPATIMTDPEFADRTYIEPITPEAVTKIIEKEKDGPFHIDALLPTLGGQTALNCACKLFDDGVLTRLGVEMIGANREVIYRAEDRKLFKEIVESIGLKMPKAGIANSMDDAWRVVETTGLPAIIRPAFTLGGTGGGIAYNREEFEDIVRRGLDASMTHQVLIDQSVLGWKEYELEVMRDHDDNVVIICTIENFDPMGVHTGDSITVAPAQTLTDKEYQQMRDAALAIIREIGVETGGCNIQFAINPSPGNDAGEMVVVEMNPRVSRSSALASKATGFAIAKIAAKLAVGYTLWELPNDITGKTVACFEPTIDYVVTKIPRWTFEKFPDADETLTTQMKSVGEAMSIGRTFKESLQKGIRSMEVKRFGLGLDANDKWLNAQRDSEKAGDFPIDPSKLRRKLTVPSQGRLYYIRYAFKMGWTIDEVYEATKIDKWFLDQIKQLVDFENDLTQCKNLEAVDRDLMFRAKQLGYSDPQLANLFLGKISTQTILKVRAYRKSLGVQPVYKLVDTCAAEFEAATPYYYSTYETPIYKYSPTDSVGSSGGRGDASPDRDGRAVYDDEIRVSDRKKIMILGGGPNRIGQGIEFDYCCVQAAFAADELGFESVMVNSNPETVSTDYDTSDLLFFEPLTLEDVLNIYDRLDAGKGLVHGVIVQFGGQTPLNLAKGLREAGVPIIGTSVDSIELAEDRERFATLLKKLDIKQPTNGIAYNVDQAIEIARHIGYPVLVRPSFVLGGRAMETVFDDEQLRHYMAIAIGASDIEGQPILIDDFLSEAIECDVDVIADFEESGQVTKWPSGQVKDHGSDSTHSATRPLGHTATSLVCGVMEHIEEAGIHSGDSACAIPPYSLPAGVVEDLRDKSRRIAEALGVRGLMNVQYAIKRSGQVAEWPSGQVKDNDSGSARSATRPLDHSATSSYETYVLEVNPRASRTVPFVSKATGLPWARIAAKVMAGKSLVELGVTEEVEPAHTSVKESVFPFSKFPGVDVILGPEMRSTGEVMGTDMDFAIAFAKSQMAAGTVLPTGGKVFLSVRDSDKPQIVSVARRLCEMGFEVHSTGGTHEFLASRGVKTQRVLKISEGRPNAIDLIKNGELSLVINTPTRKGIRSDEGRLRSTAVRFAVPMITTTTAASAAVTSIAALQSGGWGVRSLQEYAVQTPARKLARKPAAAPSGAI
ncbi:MAG: carbamoyl-phosphate synthase large subunit [Phycisphaera sp.]|nr:carbamoyl-phosphate synthase large subunit [Phycisphaera sp.]